MRNPLLVLASTVLITAFIPIGISLFTYKFDSKPDTDYHIQHKLKFENKLKNNILKI